MGGARGRWGRAALAVAGVAALVAAGYVTVIAPLLTRAEESDRTTPNQAPPAAASLAPRASGPVPDKAPAMGGEAPDPSGEPMPKGDLPGWRQVFTDNFDRNVLGPEWDVYTGQPDQDSGGYFDPSRVSVNGGLLTIGAWQDPRGGIYVTGGVSNRKVLAPQYGRFDVRFRMDQGTGIAYALLMWPKNDQYPPEIDFAEDNGRDRKTLYANVHPKIGTPIQNKIGGDFTRWHTVSLQWTADATAFSLDGKEFARMTGDDVPRQPMAMALQSQAWYCGHSWEACPDATTPPVVNLQIDWVVAYRED